MNINENCKHLTLEESVLIVIDIQEKLFPLIANREEVLKNNLILLKGAKALKLKTVLTEQYPKGLGRTVSELRDEAEDLDLWEKNSFSIGEDNQKELDDLIAAGKNTFLISGIESHICVYQSAKDLLQRGQRLVLIYDACGSRNPLHHERMIDTLRQMGALVIPTESVLFELMRNARHEAFKRISGLVK